jgi:hypothetical protein
MDIKLLQKKFAHMGARVKVGAVGGRRDRAGIDINLDAQGEFFDIKIGSDEEVAYEVVDLRPEMRHLLLLARRGERKEKFLCGHDERHWFVCAVPGSSVASVAAAMQELQPPEARASIRRRLKRIKNRLRRRNEAFVRQGEWFFIPEPELKVEERLVIRNEPISRGGGSKPHMCQFMYRAGGETVMVCRHRPNGLTLSEYRRLLKAVPAAAGWDWRSMLRDASVYVRGRVWHRDHKTIVLDDWHRVVMNTEWKAPGARTVVFLD